MNTERPKIAVVDGAHPYDVVAFHTLFRSFPDLDCYVQSLENWVWNWGDNFQNYRAVVFYNFHQALPAGLEEALLKAIDLMAVNGQGIVVWHHALLAFPNEPVWSSICGIQDRSFQYYVNQTITVVPENKQHPITEGLTPWTVQDETYTMAEPTSDAEILLTVTHPNSMHNVAWTRHYKNSRVLCLQLGHDNMVWSDPGFRELFHRGIRWSFSH